MSFSPFQVGERVQVTSYGPFRGLRGTVQTVDVMARLDELHCFYLVALEGTYSQESVWFEYDEVENPSPAAFPSCNEVSRELLT